MFLTRKECDAVTRGRGDAVTKARAIFCVSFPVSPRRRVPASLLALLLLAVGCSTQQTPKMEPVNQTPIVGDPALALRADWPQSTSHYANGDTAAWSTRFPYDLNRQNPTAASIFLEPVMFVGQTLFLPVQLVANPPFAPRVYFGAELPPTYTAQPPVPPRGGATVGRVVPFSYVGPTTPGAAAPLAPSPTGTATGTGGPAGGGTGLPAFPAPTIPTGAAPTPPPGAPGGVLGPPGGP